MDDALGVRRGQRVGDLHRGLEKLFFRQRAGFNALLQRAALEQFHHHERVPVLLADVVDRADVRVVQRGRRARLALEAFLGVRVTEELLGQHLDRNLPAQPRVLGQVNLAHPALTDLLRDAVVQQCLAGFDGHEIRV